MRKWLKAIIPLAIGLVIFPVVAFAYIEFTDSSGRSITGTVTMWLNGSNQPVATSAANPLPVSATVTATATTTATASATPTTVGAGSGAPLNIDLHSSLFVQPTFAGTPVDATHGFPVNCVVGCAGGSFNNNADAVATSSTNGQTAAWLYAWNGTAWDRLQDDASKNLKVNINASSATVPISAVALPLPTGAATAANQEVTLAGTSAASAQGVQGVTGGVALPVSGTFWQTTQPISAVSLPALPANQSVNTAQVNGVATLAGTGAVGTGAQRIAVGTDTATIAGSAPGTAGTPSTNVVTVQGPTSGGTALPVSAASLPLPTGAATAANQEVTLAGTSAASAQGVQGVTGGVALPVSAASLPLPAGASTSANQSTANTSLGTIATNTTGAATSANQSTEITSLGTLAGAVTSSVVQANTKQVNGVTTLAGAGATGTGSQRVTAAQDTTTIAGSAPGTAGSASTNVVTVQGIASGTTLPTQQSTQYPIGAVAETASTTGTTGATTATLATNTGQTTFICSFSIRANATGAATGNATVTGTITGTLNFTQWTAPLASGLGVTEMIFTPCVPASTTNTAIAVISAAPGSGGVVSVTATGFLK